MELSSNYYSLKKLQEQANLRLSNYQLTNLFSNQKKIRAKLILFKDLKKKYGENRGQELQQVDWKTTQLFRDSLEGKSEFNAKKDPEIMDELEVADLIDLILSEKGKMKARKQSLA